MGDLLALGMVALVAWLAGTRAPIPTTRPPIRSDIPPGDVPTPGKPKPDAPASKPVPPKSDTPNVSWPSVSPRSEGYLPLRRATPAQVARARDLLPLWAPGRTWPGEPTADRDILYVAARHGAKRGVEVWGRALTRGASAPPRGDERQTWDV
jgi:hypothetical protein